MTQKISSTSVAPGMATARKVYEKPEIEVIDLDEQPKLLSASTYGAGFNGVNRGGSWNDDEE